MEPDFHRPEYHQTEISRIGCLIMSGPIVRRYGFPNFEKIFGKRPLEHGIDDAKQGENPSKTEETAGATPPERSPEQSRKTDTEAKG
jgi:hypothetical protein